MKKISRTGGAKSFRCDAKSYKAYRPPKGFLVDRIVGEVRRAGVDPKIVLDIGCGNAGYLDEVSQRLSCTSVGLDRSREMLAEAAVGYASTLLVNASFNAGLPFRSCSFGLVMSVDSIHFCNSLDSLLLEVERVLSPGGLFVVCAHTENDLRRQTLGVYFPATLRFELAAARRLRGLCGAALHVGLKAISQSRDKKKFAPDRLYIELFMKKCASALHHIPASCFHKGIKDLRRAAATKRKFAAHSYTTFVFQKSFI